MISQFVRRETCDHSLVFTLDPVFSVHTSASTFVLTSSIILAYFGTEQLPLCTNVPLPYLGGPSVRTSLHLAVKKHQPTATCIASTLQMERLITYMYAGDLWQTLTVWS